ncbi:PHD finger protein 21B isoform X3 [Phyllopteryx taeniolatus]|uniref:PHD finger protein 21B isoform X3 n=1 Tax=Phyllopteryx taeniolatus TaxID=161469 RepID=UPI002AD55C05|nr:PHD finger protein 21B isoform X3 [Phyllopteryx taeniolatus]
MEVQGLQEALQVEIQCHQNPTLCKGLNELQNGQKMAVRSCPVGATKPLTLIKPTSQGIAISVVPAPVAAVTAHINGQKTPGSDPPQTLPANLQTGGRVAFGVGGRPLGGKRALELPPAQMLGSLTSVPIKVPQVSSLHRLAGQAAGVLPQVRPKTLIPDSLPHSPCPDPPQPRTTSALNHPGPTLPTPNCTLSPHRQPYDGAGEAGGPAQHASAGAGVAYAIIAASPANGNGVAAVGEAVKVIIIQPQAPGSSEGGSLPLPSQEPPPAPTKKIDEDPEKIAFMVSLGLVTNEHLEGNRFPPHPDLTCVFMGSTCAFLGVFVCLFFVEIQLKRQERKRRSTANPAYSGLFEPEDSAVVCVCPQRKRLATHYLNSPLFLSARDSEDFCWKDDVEQDERCAVCRQDGELQPCHNCPRAFHRDCLQPPLKTPPGGPWYCPKCRKKVLNKENMSWPHNFVQSYVTHKTVRQEEKRRLLRRNVELKKECAHLEEEDDELNETLKRCLDRRDRLAAQQRDTLASLERLKALIKLIQVTVTTGAPAASSSPRSPSQMKSGGPSTSPLRPSRDDAAD